jgi:gamma-glutamylcyclotransferase (GGCT)/AIG2-like uncharacterized protein YtfP
MKLRNNLFCYGTLMHAPIMQVVCGVVPPSIRAQLEGYARYGVRAHPFPGIVLEPGGMVEGILYQGVSPVMLQRLDAYESDFYQRVDVIVRDSTGATFAASTYSVPPQSRYHLLHQAWDVNRFARQTLPKYLHQLRRGMRVT